MRKDRVGTMITLDEGSSIDVRDYNPLHIDGLDGELGDGETFTLPDGCTVQRRGDEAIWTEPPKVMGGGRH
jgi:hypothetical protein